MTNQESGTGIAFVFTAILEVLILMSFLYPNKVTVIILFLVVAVHMFIYNILLTKKHNAEIDNLKAYIQVLEKVAGKELSNDRDNKNYPHNKG